ncbi:MAG TPA: DUF4159 domain-containing protein [Vicinamibacterales bacterium]|jgi:hypothetical protein|nr:DUF4159 domain-containing protein [Vicinamibacterales bacterium]
MRAVRLAVLVALLAVTASAQDPFQWRRGGFRREAPRFATPDSFDGGFSFCRLMYNSYTREAGGQGWWTDYPDADKNFSIRLSELTKTHVSRQSNGEPNHFVVQAMDDSLFQCPFVEIEDAGTAEFSDDEVVRLRQYLLKGGFLWSDDFWGTAAWDSWVSELARILPPAEYPVFDIPRDHPIFRMQFEVNAIPQIPSIQFWRTNGGETSERGSESAQVHFRGIRDQHGRLMVLMTHNTDISDAWEREGEDPRFFYQFSPDGYAVGINVLLYSMTH